MHILSKTNKNTEINELKKGAYVAPFLSDKTKVNIFFNYQNIDKKDPSK
ncbi:hypothetical protein L950_0207510 [Sphingobacterium sp. IITKGP-BTPF85]|nr:hypothetical protein L950_0207510 [Sphingobacterium sp. IITKGP-BTPF85]